MKKHSTKAEVLKHFREYILPHIPKNDIPAKRGAWNDYVDSLIKEGEVNEARAYRWANPF